MTTCERHEWNALDEGWEVEGLSGQLPEGYCLWCGAFLDEQGVAHPQVPRRVAEVLVHSHSLSLPKRFQTVAAMECVIRSAEAQVREEREAASAAAGQPKGSATP